MSPTMPRRAETLSESIRARSRLVILKVLRGRYVGISSDLVVGHSSSANLGRLPEEE